MTENQKYDVMLISFTNRVEIMKAIMSMISAGLRESKDMADNVPSTVMSNVTEKFAERSKEKLEKAGGVVEIRETQSE